MSLAEKFREYFRKYRPPRHRDKRGFHASSIMSDMRDQYWALTGEPETNPPDLAGQVKMFLGTAVDDALAKHVLSNLHWFGLHLRGAQVPVGTSNPDFDGYLDALLVERDGDKLGKQYVVEVKTKSGYGADLFARDFKVSDEYMAQMSVYLVDLAAKGVTEEGVFVFVLLSDNTIGDIAFVNVWLDKEANILWAKSYETLQGKSGTLDYSFDATIPFKRALKLKEHVASKKAPAAEYQYKLPVTDENLKNFSDAQIMKAIRGEKILGDWQALYSRFLQKRLDTDGVTRQYTDKEVEKLREHYRTRHPRSKV